MSTKQTIIDVDGMTCSSCVRHVESALRALEGIRGVNVDLQQHQVVVDHDDAGPPIDAMIAALGDAGYESRRAEKSRA
ncbi:MAG: Lead, cadmium, zinc and mercury transporting ATPase [Labilithrix sp.]|nr:Lead, cadmium, zinc and mercury transporting ATPase [Labilithrix sp.]